MDTVFTRASSSPYQRGLVDSQGKAIQISGLFCVTASETAGSAQLKTTLDGTSAWGVHALSDIQQGENTVEIDGSEYVINVQGMIAPDVNISITPAAPPYSE